MNDDDTDLKTFETIVNSILIEFSSKKVKPGPAIAALMEIIVSFCASNHNEESFEGILNLMRKEFILMKREFNKMRSKPDSPTQD